MTNRRNITYKIGITGNICTGKSLIRHTLQRCGVSTLDAEEMAINLLSDNPHRLAIRLTEALSNEVIDARGRLSRKKLNNILYTNPAKRALFEEKINPVLRDEIKRFLYSPMGTFLRAVEAPLLFETDTQHLYDEVWMVTCHPNLQVERLMTRDQLLAAEARLVIDSQWAQEKKIALSNRVFHNSGNLHDTENEVKRVLDEIKHSVFKVHL
jgi:dephospho-CoA kinase